MGKIKVVLLCHFSNKEVRRKLPLDSQRWQNVFNKIMGRRQFHYSDFAGWNTSTIRGFENIDEVQLHVVSPHYGLKKWTCEYEQNNVHYHFFRPEPLFPRNIIDKMFNKKEYINYPRTRKIVKGFINKIKPDIVNLVGAENPYYSICGLDVENVPLFITCQTVYSNPNRQKLSGKVSKHRWNLEQALFKKASAICCTNTMYRDLIKGYIPDAIVFPLTWPGGRPFPTLEASEKKYDFAFFSMSVSKKKGIDSAIEALAIVKSQKPNVTLLVVGHADEAISEELQNKIKEYGLEENVIFHDFFPSKIDMFNYVHQARFALLPVKMDFLSGTILQAMEMEMPVVTHITSGTPTLNAKRPTALLSEIGDVHTMAKQMVELMDDEQLAQQLADNGKLFMQERRNKALNGVQQILEQYKAIIDHYRYKKVIPAELLVFN